LMPMPGATARGRLAKTPIRKQAMRAVPAVAATRELRTSRCRRKGGEVAGWLGLRKLLGNSHRHKDACTDQPSVEGATCCLYSAAAGAKVALLLCLALLLLLLLYHCDPQPQPWGMPHCRLPYMQWAHHSCMPGVQPAVRGSCCCYVGA
jgi:hypothetical protein